jgi:hypothetical protein
LTSRVKSNLEVQLEGMKQRWFLFLKRFECIIEQNYEDIKDLERRKVRKEPSC